MKSLLEAVVDARPIDATGRVWELVDGEWRCILPYLKCQSCDLLMPLDGVPDGDPCHMCGGEFAVREASS